jgi:hypothetical protein
VRYYKYRLVSFTQTLVGFPLSEKPKPDRMAENKREREKTDACDKETFRTSVC